MRAHVQVGGLFLLLASLAAAAPAPNAVAQAEVVKPAPRGNVHVTYREPSDEGQAERLRDIALRMKAVSDPLNELDTVELVVVHSTRELEQRLGPGHEGALSGVSYVHGILFASPQSWQSQNPTEEALEHEMEEELVRYAALRLAGGIPLPDWLDSGLVSVLTKRPFAPASAEQVAARAPLLLTRMTEDDPAVGYWAVRYLMEERGGLVSLRQLLRLLAQRPDSFIDNLQLVYGVPVGELETAWRKWLADLAEADRKQREGHHEGPLIKNR